MASSTVAAALVAQMVAGARERGQDVDRILQQCGIAPEILAQPRSRITFQQLSNLSRALVELTGDELYGLMARPQPRNTYRLLCHCAIHAATVGEALELITDFYNVLDSGLVIATGPGRGGTAFRLTRRPRCRILNHYPLEQILLTVHRTLCWMANARLALLHVDLDYPPPDHAGEYRYIFYGAPVRYRQAHCGFTLPETAISARIVRDATDLPAFLENSPLTLMSQTFEANDLSSQVRRWVEQRIRRDARVPDIDEAAGRFRLHPQTFRRRLAREQATYQSIKAEARRDLAVHLLTGDDRPIEEIAFQLGFSESSAFVRAFRQWTGLTPLVFRNLGGSK